MGLGDCKTCAVYEARIKYLEGLLDRTLNLIAPKPEEKIDDRLKAENESEAVRFGEH